MVNGDRLFVWSGEFHPFRLPSPSLWLDILQKMKASGYNAVLHVLQLELPFRGAGSATTSPASGTWTWSCGWPRIPDYVLARPGPYINGEVNAGGFPGWLTRTAAVARTADPGYLGYWTSG